MKGEKQFFLFEWVYGEGYFWDILIIGSLRWIDGVYNETSEKLQMCFAKRIIGCIIKDNLKLYCVYSFLYLLWYMVF